MKLITKYNRVNILATIFVLLAGAVCYYLILNYVLLNQLDSDLKVEEQEINDYIRTTNALPDSANYKDQVVTFTPADSPTKRGLKSINIYSKDEDENLNIRQLVFPVTVSGKLYTASVSKSQQEKEDLLQLIAYITLGIVLFFLILLYIINRVLLNKLWQPFNNTLSELKQFNLNNKKSLVLKPSNINEFNDLNTVVTTMSKQVVKDYDSLKCFTENASHEIQTPLAIINSKLELLTQSENFTESEMQDMQLINDEIRRLSKLNQSLLLLTKINNQQFTETGTVDMVNIINKHLNKYEELFAAKQITVIKNIDAPALIVMNETLADILISNFITNAIKHNIGNGKIDISLNKNCFKIINTGSGLSIKPSELFQRFRKGEPTSESMGLGLSIVEKICERYGFKVQYNYKNGLHSLSVRFS